MCGFNWNNIGISGRLEKEKSLTNSENKIIGLDDKFKNEGNRRNHCLLTDSTSYWQTLAKGGSSEGLLLWIIHHPRLQGFKKGT